MNCQKKYINAFMWNLENGAFLLLSHVRLCDPMDYTMPGFAIHQLPKLAQTHACRVGDAIQPCHPLLSPSPPAFSLSQYQGFFPVSQFFASGGQNIGVSVSASALPMNIQNWFPLGWTGWIFLQSKGPSRVFSANTVQKHQLYTSSYNPVLLFCYSRQSASLIV